MRRSYAKNSLKNIMSKLQIFPRKIQKDLILDLNASNVHWTRNKQQCFWKFGTYYLITQ